ncbi:carbohydrate ABC transporter permease [Phytohabitans rumicis]|uniref:ABC transmembrane type-1 domain-containing protein n=1 Tax=Phytohabitans rumicis TaxID=1076125 RepID=A0A6V8L2X0_9ACTN|nr:sugar ABC transporter permease [Phytohabitans rumicis]GFJ88457.1 hypothetical protein Prum_020990 [Phytohabitans rumicis]
MVDSIHPPAEADAPSIPVRRGPEPVRPRQRRWRRRRLNRYTGAPFVLISINLLLFATFFVWPAATGLLYSFTSYTGVGDAPWVGLANYQRLLQDDAFYSALIRTLIYTAGVVPLTIVLSLGTAVLLVTDYTKGKTVARIIFFLPWLISPIIAGVIWRWIFGENFGLVNYVITKLGGSEVAWQSNANLSMFVVIIAAAWAAPRSTCCCSSPRSRTCRPRTTRRRPWTARARGPSSAGSRCPRSRPPPSSSCC